MELLVDPSLEFIRISLKVLKEEGEISANGESAARGREKKKIRMTYLKATGVLELVPLVARLRLEVGIAAQHLLSPLLNVLRILEDLHFLRRNLVHDCVRDL